MRDRALEGEGVASERMFGMESVEWATWLTAVGTIGLAAVTAITVLSTRRGDRVRVWRVGRDQVIRDLDETRRLVMTAIYRPESLGDPLLYGTILHAVSKHSRLLPDEKRADQMLKAWMGTQSHVEGLEAFVVILDRELARLVALPDLAVIELDMSQHA